MSFLKTILRPWTYESRLLCLEADRKATAILIEQSKSSICDLEQAVPKQSLEITSLKERIVELEATVQGHASEIEAAKHQASALRNDLEAGDKHLAEVQVQLSSKLLRIESVAEDSVIRVDEHARVLHRMSAMLSEPEERLKLQAGEIERLRGLAADPETKLQQKNKLIGKLVQWIKLAHRLDVPIAPNTMRQVLEESQHEKPASDPGPSGVAVG
jgi:chromosome segregation ATPase